MWISEMGQEQTQEAFLYRGDERQFDRGAGPQVNKCSPLRECKFVGAGLIG